MRVIRSRAAQLFVLASTAACSASVTDFASGGIDSVGPDVELDASAPETVTDCPASLPQSGSSCLAFSAQCEYGWAAEESCNAFASCSGGRWSVQRPSDTCIDTCPSSYDDRQEGDACDSVGAVCSFYEGTCGCVADDDGGAPDAGDSGDAGAASGHWRCHVPQDGCPARRPRSGEACVKSMVCDYGSCVFQRDLSFDCNGGYWSLADYPDCP